MITERTHLPLTLFLAAALTAAVQGQTYPRTLVAQAEATGANGAATATVTIRIDRLMSDRNFTKVSDALKYGGFVKFVPALRALPPIGYVQIGDAKTILKYVRVRSGDSPRLVLGTDRPIFFIGGGAPDAKPRTGYEVGVIELDLDAQGNGVGTMDPAARVKPAPDGGVVLDGYAPPLKLTVKPAE